MDERKEITILKSGNPEKVVVVRATSMKDQIRFYLNETQYVAAIDCKDGKISVKIGEDEKKEEQKRNVRNNKESFKEIALFLPIIIILGVALTMVQIYMIYLTQNLFIGIFLMEIIACLTVLSSLIISKIIRVPTSVKSKHSAEHMMVNFIENNNRLPKSMEEIKESSRFSTECGSRDMVQDIAKRFVTCTISAIVAVSANIAIVYFFNDSILGSIVFLLLYYFIKLTTNILTKKSEKMKSLINPIKNVFSKLVQCASTTKKVEEFDILIAYFSAREWMEIVYPEFYNKEEDVFLDNYLKS